MAHHGDAGGVQAVAPPDDPALALVTANQHEWLALEAAFCSCDALCTCGWDDPEETDAQAS